MQANQLQILDNKCYQDPKMLHTFFNYVYAGMKKAIQFQYAYIKCWSKKISLCFAILWHFEESKKYLSKTVFGAIIQGVNLYFCTRFNYGQ